MDLKELSEKIRENPEEFIKELYKLHLIIEDQSMQIKSLLEENKLLREENENLKSRIRILEGQISKDSHNSSKPPSSDGFKKKIYNNRKSGSRPVGGQKGHKGETLKMVEVPDKVEIHKVSQCKVCGISLKKSKVIRYERHQVFEVPELKIEVIEHQGEIKRCPVCGIENKAVFPEEAGNIVQYGMKFKTLATYLKEYQYLSCERLSEFFKDVFSHSMSEGTFNNFSEDCHNSLEGYENEVKECLKVSPVVGFDETGFRYNGKRHWLHVASTEKLTYYSVEEKRGKEGMDNGGILPDFPGKAVHDYWSPYFKYNCLHALCNAHHLRELIYMFEEEKQEWASKMISLLIEIKASVDTAKPVINCLVTEVLRKFERKYDGIIEEGLDNLPDIVNTQPNKRGRKKQSKSKNLLDRLKNHKEEVLAFMYDFQVPFDNNQSERDLRMMKLKQKISGTFRSENGTKYFARIRSYISTVRKHGLNILEAIQNAFAGKPFIPVMARGG
jgi:transposase